MKLVIVGLGWAGQRQAQAVREELDGEIELVGLVDNDEAHLHRVAGEMGIDKVATRLSYMLDEGGFDAVSLCTPHGLHAQHAVIAAEAGKHVLVEKPMAFNVDEASAMLRIADRHHVRLYVAESATYHPMTAYLRQVVTTQRHIGELVSARIVAGFRAPDYGYADRRAWLSDPEQGGTGTWMLHGIHTVAQMRAILGEAQSVYASAHRAASFQRDNIEGTMSVHIQLESGASVHLVQTAEAKAPNRLGGYTLLGDRGALHCTPEVCTFIDDDGNEETEAIAPAHRSPYADELAAFHALVTRGISGPTDGVSERKSLAIVQAAIEAAETGEAVNLKKRFGRL